MRCGCAFEWGGPGARLDDLFDFDVGTPGAGLPLGVRPTPPFGRCVSRRHSPRSVALALALARQRTKPLRSAGLMEDQPFGRVSSRESTTICIYIPGATKGWCLVTK